MQKYTDFKKHFGQNFIRDTESVNKAIRSIDIQPEDLVIEIGPGDGKVTEHLVQHTKNLILIEIDSELVARLKEKFSTIPNLEIINKSVLDIDFNELAKSYAQYKVIGSLPYNISKKIIKILIESKNKPKTMSFIVQKEVAQDYAAIAPGATFLSNFASIFYEVKYIGTVKKEKFVPKPKVDGGIIQLTLKISPEISADKYADFAKFLYNCFRQPRKMLKNVLKSIYKEADWEGEFIKNNINSNARSSELTINNFKALYISLKQESFTS